MLDAIAQHKYPAKIAILAGRRKFKIVFAQKAKLATLIAFETEFFKEDSLIEKLYLHLLAVVLSRFYGYLLGAHSLNPIEGYSRHKSQPDDGINIKAHDSDRQETEPIRWGQPNAKQARTASSTAQPGQTKRAIDCSTALFCRKA